jgi:transglutaminase-like putative cysteine protease
MEKYSLKIEPTHQLRWRRDLQENDIGLLDMIPPAKRLLIEMECVVEVAQDNPFNFTLTPEASEFPFEYNAEISPQLKGLSDPLFPRDIQPIREWLHPIWHPGKRGKTLDLLQEINKAIYRDIRYQRRERKGVQSPAETLERKSGTCRDFAALFMEICHLMGLATRFVSGYMYSPTIEGRMSMHGWAEVYLPGAGWLGFDPSWGILTTTFYIPVAVSRHPEHVPPISGTFFGFARDFLKTEVDLYVKPVGQSKPVAV